MRWWLWEGIFFSAIAKDDYNESALSDSISSPPAHAPFNHLLSGALPTPVQFWEHHDDRDNNSNSVSDDEKPEGSEEDGRILGMPATMSPSGHAKPTKSAEKDI